jgi:RNA-directed DNA polymerase
MKPGNSGGGKDPDFRCAFEDGEGKGRLAMSLETPDKIRSLQRKKALL